MHELLDGLLALAEHLGGLRERDPLSLGRWRSGTKRVSHVQRTVLSTSGTAARLSAWKTRTVGGLNRVNFVGLVGLVGDTLQQILFVENVVRHALRDGCVKS